MLPSTLTADAARKSAVRRRSVVAGAAWSVPVVVAAGAAPAYAASPCTGGAAAGVTWAANSSGDTNFTTQTGTLTGNTLTVLSEYNSTAAGTGSLSATRNMVSPSPAAGSTSASFELSNNIPPTTAADPSIYWQTATFTFTKRVARLTFTIDDIDSATGATGFYDRVAIITEAASTATGTFRTPTTLTGTGSLTSPWQTSGANAPGAYVATQAVDVAITGGFNTFSIRYWTTLGASNNNANPTSTQMWIRINNMQVRSCP